MRRAAAAMLRVQRAVAEVAGAVALVVRVAVAGIIVGHSEALPPAAARRTA
jgi:hypothetical protein